MIPTFKQNGLIWTLLNTSNIPSIVYYIVLIPLKLVWSEEKIDLIKLISYENISHSHALPVPNLQSFQFHLLYHKAG